MSSSYIDFSTHVTIYFREKAPKGGAMLLQTTSNDIPSTMNVIQSILDRFNIDTKPRRANGDVRIVFDCEISGKKQREYIHTYGIALRDLFKKTVIDTLLVENKELIYDWHLDSEMNWHPISFREDIKRNLEKKKQITNS